MTFFEHLFTTNASAVNKYFLQLSFHANANSCSNPPTPASGYFSHWQLESPDCDTLSKHPFAVKENKKGVRCRGM